MSEVSILEKLRAGYHPKLPAVFAENGPWVRAATGEPTRSVADAAAISKLFPNTYGLPVVTFEPDVKRTTTALTVGVILSGGQAPGGHNVIAGILDGLEALNPDNRLLGFLGGPSGLIEDRCIRIAPDLAALYRNTGGFDMIRSGRTKVETEEQFRAVAQTCRNRGLNALVVIGGDDSNTNACLLAEDFLQNNIDVQVIGCPKTIDGDLKNAQIEASFGFATATRVYSELIGNIERDANSAQKYWHFIRLMGRSASHITLECALQTHPNVAVISEEVAAEGLTLRELAEGIAAVVRDRAAAGMNFGVVLIPEGLIEFVPEIKTLIGELSDLLAANAGLFKSLSSTDEQLQFINSKLGRESSQAFSSLPHNIQLQLLMDRDPHGNVQVSRIETEKLLVDMVKAVLREWRGAGTYSGKFSAQTHFFGYEGRCAPPCNFDADYCYSLGYTAAALIAAGKTGYMAAVRGLAGPAAQWTAGGVPLTMMMNMERRHGEDRPVIRKALVDLGGKPFAEFANRRSEWAAGNCYLYPGPIQYFGASELCDRPPLTLELECG
ncbi:MAG: diphosphate--fructose-6-phosphate 1-phosphotransferase [Kiritimatiellaeota bacterium]|nr:diphosphate--fructose-6-phosphate 1-phosphotransferase [Kiritimatiellota bacterium]